jgi:hypothetical protein
MVHRQAEGDVAAAVVTGHGEAVVTERAHHLVLQRQLALKGAKPGQIELNGAED